MWSVRLAFIIVITLNWKKSLCPWVRCIFMLFLSLVNNLYHGLKELVTPVTETLVTVCCFLAVCSSQVLDPLHEQILVLLEQQELSQHHVRLVKSLALQSLPQHLSNTCQVSDSLVSHGLCHEVPVFLRCGGHGYSTLSLWNQLHRDIETRSCLLEDHNN